MLALGTPLQLVDYPRSDLFFPVVIASLLRGPAILQVGGPVIESSAGWIALHRGTMGCVQPAFDYALELLDTNGTSAPHGVDPLGVSALSQACCRAGSLAC